MVIGLFGVLPWDVDADEALTIAKRVVSARSEQFDPGRLWYAGGKQGRDVDQIGAGKIGPLMNQSVVEQTGPRLKERFYEGYYFGLWRFTQQRQGVHPKENSAQRLLSMSISVAV